jgi:hypothetical protein
MSPHATVAFAPFKGETECMHRRRAPAIARRAIVVAGLAIASGSEAWAQSGGGQDERRVSFTWTLGAGAESCASQAELERRVTARLGRDPFAVGAPRSLEARVTAKGRGRVAALTLRDRPGNALGERSFESSDASCASLEDAAVLAIALLIDPEAALAPTPPGGGAAAPPGQAGTQAPEARAVLWPIWIPVAVPARAPPQAPRSDPRPVRVGAAIPLTVALGPLPRAAVGTGLLVDIEPVRRAHLVASLSWLPAVSTDDGELSFSMVTGALGACVDPWSRWRWAIGLCAGIRAGAIEAVSHRLTPVDPGEQPWIQADASLRLSLQPVGPLWLGAEGGASLVALRPRFRIVGREGAALSPSRVGASASAWAGVRFP